MLTPRRHREQAARHEGRAHPLRDRLRVEVLPAARAAGLHGRRLERGARAAGARLRQRPRPANVIDRAKGRVALSKIFHWNRKEFERDGGTLLKFVSRYGADAATASYIGRPIRRTRNSSTTTGLRPSRRCEPVEKEAPCGALKEEIVACCPILRTRPCALAWRLNDPAAIEAGARSLRGPAPPVASSPARWPRGGGRLGRPSPRSWTRAGPSARTGAFPGSQILARLWTFDGRVPDKALFRARFEAARRVARGGPSPETTGFRAINSEGDLCPGVLLDVYGETAVLDLLTEGTEKWRSRLTAAARRPPSQPREICDPPDRRRSRPRRPLANRQSDSSTTRQPRLVPFTRERPPILRRRLRRPEDRLLLDQRDNRARLRPLAGAERS